MASVYVLQSLSDLFYALETNPKVIPRMFELAIEPIVYYQAPNLRANRPLTRNVRRANCYIENNRRSLYI